MNYYRCNIDFIVVEIRTLLIGSLRYRYFLPTNFVLSKIAPFSYFRPELVQPQYLTLIVLRRIWQMHCFRCDVYFIVVEIITRPIGSLRYCYIGFNSHQICAFSSKVVYLSFEPICVCSIKQKVRYSTIYFLKQLDTTKKKYVASLNYTIYSIYFKLLKRKNQAIPCINYIKKPEKVQLGYYFLLRAGSDYLVTFGATLLLSIFTPLTSGSMIRCAGLFERRRRLRFTRRYGIC